MRLFLLLCTLAAAMPAAVPPALEAALRDFRGDPPRGWSYTLTTVAEGKSTVERYDATKAEFERWSLVQKDGRVPSDDERKTYSEMRSRRSRGGTAPRLTDQLDVASAELLGETETHATFRCALRPGESGDRTAAFLRAILVVHKPTHSVESVELSSTVEFTPALGVKIKALRTVMTYTPGPSGLPPFPRSVTTHVRGRAFWFKSLDADMTVTYTDYAPARKK